MDQLRPRHKDELLSKIEQAAGEYIKGSGYDLVEASFSKAKRGLSVRFLIDKPAGGISLEECSKLNEGLSEVLDRENIIEGSYMLEVSSPGVDRPLATEKDFLRVLGRWVRVFLQEPVRGRMDWEGIVDKVQDNFLFLRTDRNIETIALPKIKKAKQVIR